MAKSIYDPKKEAKALGLKVRLIDFKRLNSFLTESVIYLKKNLSKIEARCCLTYEVVHYTRGHFNANGFCSGHSKEEDEIIRQETAKKLIPAARLYELLESCSSIDEIAYELKVTNEVLAYYFKYCRSKQITIPASECCTSLIK